VAGILRTFLDGQIALSRGFDRWLPEKYSIDGNTDFKDSILPRYLTRDMVVYDVGGGSRPYVDVALKRNWNLKVVGLDIDAKELSAAPPGSYDATVCADLTAYHGPNDADLVICQAALEHVRDAEKAFAALATIAKPGGRVAVFVPSRNAVFARLNLLLPERVKHFLLFSIFPHKQRMHEGFKAYYDKCTPKHFARMAGKYGFQIELQKSYFMSSYFSFFAPAYVLWRLWILVFHAVAGAQAAETFAMVLRLSRPPAGHLAAHGNNDYRRLDQGERQKPPVVMTHEAGPAASPPDSGAAASPHVRSGARAPGGASAAAACRGWCTAPRGCARSPDRHGSNADRNGQTEAVAG
jgi:SAM-dependent methyltransferase